MARTLDYYKNTYETLNKLKKSLGVVGLLGLPFGELSAILVGITGYAASACLANYTYERSTNCSEYEDFNKIYQVIKENILEYKDILEITSIEEIYTYVVYLYQNGYLCYNRELKADIQNIYFNQLAILEALALNRHGECKNIAALLASIYNATSANSYVLAGSYHNSLNKIDTNNINHAITVVLKNGLSYYLDPSKEQVYEKSTDATFTVKGNDIFALKEESKKHYQNKIYLYEKEKGVEKDILAITLEIAAAQAKLEDNLDVIKKLYKELVPQLEEAECVYQRILKSL